MTGNHLVVWVVIVRPVVGVQTLAETGFLFLSSTAVWLRQPYQTGTITIIMTTIHSMLLTSHPAFLTSHPMLLAWHLMLLTSHPAFLASHPMLLASQLMLLASHPMCWWNHILCKIPQAADLLFSVTLYPMLLASCSCCWHRILCLKHHAPSCPYPTKLSLYATP